VALPQARRGARASSTRTTFVLRVKLPALLAAEPRTDLPLYYTQWRTLLRTLSHSRTTRRYGARLEPQLVIAFLLFDANVASLAPLRSCCAQGVLEVIAGLGNLTPAGRLVGRLLADFCYDEEELMRGPTSPVSSTRGRRAEQDARYAGHAVLPDLMFLEVEHTLSFSSTTATSASRFSSCACSEDDAEPDVTSFELAVGRPTACSGTATGTTNLTHYFTITSSRSDRGRRARARPHSYGEPDGPLAPGPAGPGRAALSTP